MRRYLVAALLAGAALMGCSTSSAPLCETDASCAALGIGTGYGVTEAMVAAAAQLPAGCVSAYTGQPGEDPTVAWCGPVFVAEATASPAEWDCLRGLGYVGDPLDGVEALYADASDVAECSPRPA